MHVQTHKTPTLGKRTRPSLRLRFRVDRSLRKRLHLGRGRPQIPRPTGTGARDRRARPLVGRRPRPRRRLLLRLRRRRRRLAPVVLRRRALPPQAQAENDATRRTRGARASSRWRARRLRPPATRRSSSSPRRAAGRWVRRRPRAAAAPRRCAACRAAAEVRDHREDAEGARRRLEDRRPLRRRRGRAVQVGVGAEPVVALSHPRRRRPRAPPLHPAARHHAAGAPRRPPRPPAPPSQPLPAARPAPPPAAPSRPRLPPPPPTPAHPDPRPSAGSPTRTASSSWRDFPALTNRDELKIHSVPSSRFDDTWETRDYPGCAKDDDDEWVAGCPAWVKSAHGSCARASSRRSARTCTVVDEPWAEDRFSREDATTYALCKCAPPAAAAPPRPRPPPRAY